MDSGVIRHVHDLIVRATDPYMDGFYTFEQKKTLYMIKKIIDDALPNIHEHVGEQEWLKQQGIKNGN